MQAAAGGGGSVATLGFANFSAALLREPSSGEVKSVEGVDYSRQWLSSDSRRREALARRLAVGGKALQEELGAPQDVEGAVVGDTIYVVQSRPQPL